MIIMNFPLVSVYIPTRNRSKLLHRAVHSVLEQSYDNFEVIIVDDGSTDETYTIAKELENQNKNIIVLRNEIARGACVSRNLAISHSKGEYITGLDDDDYSKKKGSGTL